MPPRVARPGWGDEGVEQHGAVANGACCSGGRGMEVRKEQQASVRRKQVALYPLHCGQFSLEHKRTTAHYQTSNGPLEIHLFRAGGGHLSMFIDVCLDIFGHCPRHASSNGLA